MSKYETPEFWDKLFESGKEFMDVNLVLFDRIIDRLSATGGQRPETALDLGCGTGELCVAAGTRGLSVKGLDISKVGISKARMRLSDHPELEGRVTFEQRDLNQVDEAGETEKVDVVFMRLTFAFIKDRLRFLRYIKNCLTTNGKFVLMTPVLVSGYEHSDFMKLIAVPLEEVQDVLSNSFSKVEVFNCSYAGKTWVDMTYVLSDEP
ncbi:MAG: class I SAM-dependent methyltransferase [Candidatus Competibacteraceae bacterium]|nr:class I SAM-dependent methyltransferase [Candidatus Competibacteraceae bacterium]